MTRTKIRDERDEKSNMIAKLATESLSLLFHAARGHHREGPQIRGKKLVVSRVSETKVRTQ